MSVQLARYLKDFSAPPRVRAPAFAPSSFAQEESRMAAEPFAMLPVESAVDVEAERAEAFAQGRAEAEAEFLARHEAEIAALKEAQQTELDTLRARYEHEYAAALAGHFATMTGQVAELVAAQAAHVLAPVMNDVLTKGAVAELARMIIEGLPGDEGIVITVTGPSNLFEQLKSHFDDPAPILKHVEMQDVDLAVEFGDTVLVTRMAAWADTVRKVLA